MSIQLHPEHYLVLEKAIAYLESHYREQPCLETLAQHVGLSSSYFQRLFQSGVGVSPKRFLQYTTLTQARRYLFADRPVLETSLALGLSGSSRLHDLFIQWEAVTPGRVSQRGKGLELHYGVHKTPLGPMLLALSERGICELAFLPDRRHAPGESVSESLTRKWPAARLIHAPAQTEATATAVFAPVRSQPLQLQLLGTPFQLRIWRALLEIPAGQWSAYGDLCQALGQSATAARAVGTAVGQNPISYLIPCHRVLRQNGHIGGYAGGTARKRILLALEQQPHLQPDS